MDWVALSAGRCGSECVEYSKGKNIFLFVMSLLFYAYGEPKYVLCILNVIHDFVPLLFRFMHRKVSFKMDWVAPSPWNTHFYFWIKISFQKIKAKL